jgi:hypothetical protein
VVEAVALAAAPMSLESLRRRRPARVEARPLPRPRIQEMIAI